MSTTQEFSIEQVLTVTTGRFLLQDVGKLYEILNFMTGESLYTHQLVRANEPCRTSLFRQHPFLEGIDAPHVTGENWKSWLDSLDAPKAIEVASLNEGEYTPMNPLSELRKMTDKPIVAVTTDDAGDQIVGQMVEDCRNEDEGAPPNAR